VAVDGSAALSIEFLDVGINGLVVLESLNVLLQGGVVFAELGNVLDEFEVELIHNRG